MSRQPNPIADPAVVLHEEFDDWAVLFNPNSAEAVGINAMGIAIWKLLDGDHDLDQIAIEIYELFDEVPDSAAEEIAGFIDDLASRGFIRYGA